MNMIEMSAQRASERRLDTLQSRLITQMTKAYHCPDLVQRNTIAARVVSSISSELAIKSLNISDTDAPEVESIFTHACRRAGGAFFVAFTPEGKPLKEREGAYKAAQNAAADIAATYNLYTPHVLRSVSALMGVQKRRIDVISTLNAVDFFDVSTLIARQLRLHVSPLDKEQVQDILHSSVSSDDFFYKEIDTISYVHDTTLDVLSLLDSATRLANATWLVGQVHRAVWERKIDRINPLVRQAFNPYDILKKNQYLTFSDNGIHPDVGIIRVAFEVWKDVAMLQKYLPSK